MDDPLETAPGGFVSFDAEGRIVRVNQTLLDLLGFAASDVVGTPFESLLTRPNRIFYQTHFLPLLRLHGRADEIFLNFRTGTGDSLPVLMNAAERETPEGTVVVGIFLPLRQREKYEQEILSAKRVAEDALRTNDALTAAKQDLENRTRELDRKISRLEQKNDELTRLNSILSHDLKEPVRKITLFTDILYQEHREFLTEIGHEAVDRILASCSRIHKLLRTLQQYTALDAEDEPLTRVDLDEVLDWALEHIVDETGARPTVERPPLPSVEGYESQLRALFFNLLDNAVKFRRESVPLQVHVECAIVPSNAYTALRDKYHYVDFARITLADNGIGFEQRYSEYVTGMLTKLDAGTPGLGYGLAICKKVTDNHYGSLMLESSPGRGTRATVMLPLKQ